MSIYVQDSNHIEGYRHLARSYAEMINNPREGAPFQVVGMHQTDKAARQKFAQILSLLADENGRRIHQKPGIDSGTYFLSDVGVFKIGRRRAAMELLVRESAHLLGLSEHVTPGALAVVRDFPGSEPNAIDPVKELLWNGHLKFYAPAQESSVESPNSVPQRHEYFFAGQEQEESASGDVSIVSDTAEKVDQVVIGILEPFVPCPPAEISQLDFTRMTLLALAVGLRDAKKTGYVGSTLFDVEDCFPLYIDPPEEREDTCPAATDLRYLTDDPRTGRSLFLGDVEKLARVVQKWDIDALIAHLADKIIPYADTLCEEATDAVDEEENFEEESFRDDQGNKVQILRGVHHPINGFPDQWTNNPDKKMLCAEQLSALRTRLERARTFILESAQSKVVFSPIDLVYAVDTRARALAEVMSSTPDPSIQRLRATTLSSLDCAALFQTPKTPKRPGGGSPVISETPKRPGGGSPVLSEQYWMSESFIHTVLAIAGADNKA